MNAWRGRPAIMSLAEYRRIVEVKAFRQAGVKHPTNRELSEELGIPAYLVRSALRNGIKRYDWELRDGKAP